MFQHECPHHGLCDHKLISNGPGRARRRQCVPCFRIRQRRVRRRKKTHLVESAGGKCVLCGYNKWLAALDFHHLDPATKSDGIGAMVCARDLNTCIAEAAKCVLICANCHREIETECQATIEALAKYQSGAGRSRTD